MAKSARRKGAAPPIELDDLALDKLIRSALALTRSDDALHIDSSDESNIAADDMSEIDPAYVKLILENQSFKIPQYVRTILREYSGLLPQKSARIKQNKKIAAPTAPSRRSLVSKTSSYINLIKGDSTYGDLPVYSIQVSPAAFFGALSLSLDSYDAGLLMQAIKETHGEHAVPVDGHTKATLHPSAIYNQQVINHPDYLLFLQADHRAIDHHKAALAQQMKRKLMVELGPAYGDKTEYLIKALSEFGGTPRLYYGIDTIFGCLAPAKKKLGAFFRNADAVTMTHGDYERAPLWDRHLAPLCHAQSEKGIGIAFVELGLTVGNRDDSKLVWLLRKARECVRVGDTFTISNNATGTTGDGVSDIAAELQTLASGYSRAEIFTRVAAHFAVSASGYVPLDQRQSSGATLNIGIHRDDEKDITAVIREIRCHPPQRLHNFALQYDPRASLIDKIILPSSQQRSIKHIQALAESAGWELCEVYPDPGPTRVALLTLRAATGPR